MAVYSARYQVIPGKKILEIIGNGNYERNF